MCPLRPAAIIPVASFRDALVASSPWATPACEGRMGLQERLEGDQRDAMRGGHALRLNTIRLLRSAIHNEEIERGRVLTDKEMVETVLARQIRQRRESIAEFLKAGRQDLVDREEAELQVLLTYQPEQLSEIEIEALARATILELGATGPREQGKVMGKLASQLRGKADLGAVGQVVQRLLSADALPPSKGGGAPSRSGGP